MFQLKQITLLLTFFLLGILTSYAIGFLPNAANITPSQSRLNIPTCTVLVEKQGYSLAYDLRTRNAKWVYERLTLNSLLGNEPRIKSFKEDSAIPEIFRTSLADYRNCGFDRGHMACAANHKSSADEMKETFLLSNICPQAAQFNRGYWAKLERYVRDLTNYYEVVEVYTGAMYLPKEDADGKRWVTYQVIGKNDVAVPTHFFKIICLASDFESYILPNEAIPADTPLDEFKTTLLKVEKASGVIFFP